MTINTSDSSVAYLVVNILVLLCLGGFVLYDKTNKKISATGFYINLAAIVVFVLTGLILTILSQKETTSDLEKKEIAKTAKILYIVALIGTFIYGIILSLIYYYMNKK